MLSRVIVFIIWSLLFSLGLEVGADRSIMDHLGALGATALGVTAAALMGSVLMATLLWVGIRKEKGRVRCPEQRERKTRGFGDNLLLLWKSLKGGLIIVAFFIAGVMSGRLSVLSFDFQAFPLTNYVLYLLLLCVGMTIGVDVDFFRQIRNLDRKLLLLPLMTACGTFVGVALWWLVTRRYLLTDCLALGSGFAYYSLSSIFITEMRGAELGIVALLCNLFREILALLLIPFAARHANPLAAISMGGATTFDTTLPVILQSVGKSYLVVAAFHGLLLDLSVPFLVTLFCSAAR